MINQKPDKQDTGQGNKDILPAKKNVSYWQELLCIFACFVLYVNTFGHGYVLDDTGAITENEYVQMGAKGIHKLLTVNFWHFNNINLGYYRPLALITFALEKELIGLNPQMSHFINVLIYCLIGIAIFRLLQKWFYDLHLLFTLAVTLLFIAHPLHTEVVSNIKSRDELLSFLFLVLSLNAVYHYAVSRSGYDLFKTAVLFYLSLLSKESSIVGILLAPVSLYFFTQATKNQITKSASMFLMVFGIFMLQKYLLMGTLMGDVPYDIVNYPYSSFDIRMPTAFSIFLLISRLMVFPYPLIYDYSYNSIPAAGWMEWRVLSGVALFILLLSAGLIMTLKKKKAGFGLLFYFICLLPSFAYIILRGGTFAERMTFSSVLGFCLAFVCGTAFIFKINYREPQFAMSGFIRKNRAGCILLIAVLILFSFLTVSRNTVWKSNFTLFTHDVKYASDSAQVNKHCGSTYINMAVVEKGPELKEEYFRKGMQYLEKAINIHPEFGEAYFKKAVGYHLVKGHYGLAEKYYLKAIETSPQYANSYSNLGHLYETLGKNELALYYYNKAVEINPYFRFAQESAALLKERKGF